MNDWNKVANELYQKWLECRTKLWIMGFVPTGCLGDDIPFVNNWKLEK